MKNLSIQFTEISEKQLSKFNKKTELNLETLKDNIQNSIIKFLVEIKFNINYWISYNGFRVIKISSDWNKVIFKLRFPCKKWADKDGSKRECRVVVYLDKRLYEMSILYVYNKTHIIDFFGNKKIKSNARKDSPDTKIIEKAIKKDYKEILEKIK